jgi:hypothetical protein
MNHEGHEEMQETMDVIETADSFVGASPGFLRALRVLRGERLCPFAVQLTTLESAR